MTDSIPQILHPIDELKLLENRIREGRFQRSLSLLTAATSVFSGLEVAYEHYRGSYSRRIMYTPVILSGILAAAGVAAFFSRRAARTVLRLAAAVTLIDAGIGFYFPVRGIQRKPGGWRLPMTNMIMGPPIFAPLLFGTSAYLGLIASYLQREDANEIEQSDRRGIDTWLARLLPPREAYYSHYKNNFRYAVQWTPIIIAPLLAAASFAATRSGRIATKALPAISAVAAADSAIGFYYHARGVLRRPGGSRHLLYNIIYGPPIFAPLLFGAAGMLGILASLLRRRRP